LKKIVTKIQKRKEKEKERKILWITIVIHGAMGMSEQ
jgi:hypothetical protein